MSINDGMIKLIKKYQNNKPPGTPSRCIHYPSCSNYGIGCYQKFNFIKATILTTKRVICCTPLNRKTYDPVPLNRKEKKADKELTKEAKLIKPILIKHYKKYNQMQIEDFIKLIYQNSFGPNHLIDNVNEIKDRICDEIAPLCNIKEYYEDIGNGYTRVYLCKNTNIDKLSNLFLSSQTNNNEDIRTITLFYKKLNVLNKLINNRKIKLPRKESIKYISNYMSNGVKPINHSKTYKFAYNPHYRIIKTELIKKED